MQPSCCLAQFVRLPLACILMEKDCFRTNADHTLFGWWIMSYNCIANGETVCLCCLKNKKKIILYLPLK